MKITNRNQVVKLLKDNGFEVERRGKHDKWTNGEKTVFLPRKHTGNFSVSLHKRVLKEVGIL